MDDKQTRGLKFTKDFTDTENTCADENEGLKVDWDFRCTDGFVGICIDGALEKHHYETISPPSRGEDRYCVSSPEIRKQVSCAKRTVKNLLPFKKVAFTKPSRGTNEVRGERQSTETLSFRCCRERCRLMRGVAFTLAEVLITLGIIGVVAALTLPSVIQNYRRHVVETRLEKFYSTINQAVTRSELDNGDKSGWEFFHMDDNEHNLEWYNKYLAPYLLTLKVEVDSNKYVLIYFPDGSLLLLRRGGTTYNFFPNAKAYEKVKDNLSIEQINAGLELYGKDMFHFAFMPSIDDYRWRYHKGKGIEPYKWATTSKMIDIDFRSGYYGCSDEGNKIYCAALIQQNGWKIPKDYPLRF